MKILTLTLLAAGLAAAQPGTFTGQHFLDDTCYPTAPSAENGCSYVGTISGDPNSAYASVLDTTGVTLPWSPFTRTPPPMVNLSGPWSASLSWQNGAEVSGTTTATGMCTMTGGPVSSYQANYTVQCIGTDSRGNPASKVHYYTIRTGRFGYWQPIQEAPFSTVTFQVY